MSWQRCSGRLRGRSCSGRRATPAGPTCTSRTWQPESTLNWQPESTLKRPRSSSRGPVAQPSWRRLDDGGGRCTFPNGCGGRWSRVGLGASSHSAACSFSSPSSGCWPESTTALSSARPNPRPGISTRSSACCRPPATAFAQGIQRGLRKPSTQPWIRFPPRGPAGHSRAKSEPQSKPNAPARPTNDALRI